MSNNKIGLLHRYAVIAVLVMAVGCRVGGSSAESTDAGSPSDAMEREPAPDASVSLPNHDAAVNDAAVHDAAVAVPLVFNIIMRQSVQACGSCGIWFDYQGNQGDKPRLVVEYEHLGQMHTAEFQHGLAGMDNAHSFFITGGNDGTKHALLIKQTPSRNGLFWADISAIPPAATITAARLHLHIHEAEGLANSDNSSVLDVHVCERAWNWDQVSWTQYAAGQAWSSAGGDFGPLIRQLRAKEDMKDRGFSKANPRAHFDFTDYVRQLQAAR